MWYKPRITVKQDFTYRQKEVVCIRDKKHFDLTLHLTSCKNLAVRQDTELYVAIYCITSNYCQSRINTGSHLVVWVKHTSI